LALCRRDLSIAAGCSLKVARAFLRLNVTYPFYVEDHSLIRPAQPGYLEFLSTMTPGTAALIVQDMPSIIKATVQANFASGEAGASSSRFPTSAAISWPSRRSDFKISAAPSIAASKGVRPQFSHRNIGIRLVLLGGIHDCAIPKRRCAVRLCLSEDGQFFCAYCTEGYSF
jgi:hypothetical protein